MKARNTMFRAGWLSGRYWDRTSDLFRVREARSRDPHLGKVMLYQLSHIRAPPARSR